MNDSRPRFGSKRFVAEALSVTALVDEVFHSLLLRFRAAATAYSTDGRRFEEVHEGLIMEFGNVASIAFLSAGRGVHAPSDFPLSVREVLQSRSLEGAVGNLAVWTANLNRRVDRLLLLSDSVWARDSTPGRAF